MPWPASRPTTSDPSSAGPQDPHLFDATIRDNLRLARPDATGEELQDAAARARLLLILDEPTAHLDPASRRVLTANLLHATQDRSVLFITHQPDGLDQVDHIVVLNHGRIAEQGTHQQLRHAGGPYQRMWDSEHQPLVP